METLELERFGTSELTFEEKKMTSGGNPIWIGIGAALAVMAIYDAINGFYAGMRAGFGIK